MNDTIKDRSERLGIYCHIPFCVKKCAYCDFASFAGAGDAAVAAYFTALWQEIKQFGIENAALDKRVPAVDTIYFGGGTPSSVPAEYIEKTMRLIHEIFGVAKAAEKTIEINPGTLSPQKAASYRAAGFNRISVGLQAWQDELLKRLGRIHCQADFVRCMEMLKRAGFENISVDVMYGLPGQNLADLSETLTALMAFSPTHLSCYSLILEEGTPLMKQVAAGGLELPDEATEREMHWLVDRFLTEKGYRHYEISSYCQPGWESRHNLKYWELSPYLGFGLGASGFFDETRYTNTHDLEKYCRLIEGGQRPGEAEPKMTLPECRRDWMFLGLRKLDGIDDRDFGKKFTGSFFDIYKEEIDSLTAEGLLTREGTLLRLTPRGQDFANQVFMAFV
jgi:oxygen-independent coproporphyrinogen-3 oxidase